MEQKLKKLLIKELCSRLPYSLKVKRPDDGCPDYVSAIDVDAGTLTCLYNGYTDEIEKFVPYLRPMSSMTEEEKKEMHEKLSPTGTAIYKEEGISTPLNHYGDWIPYEYMSRIIDWLNAHHFDFHNLIGCGLALEAPNGMYDLENK